MLAEIYMLRLEAAARATATATTSSRFVPIARDCQDFCVRRFPSCAHEALFEHDGELRLRLGPLSRRSFPIRNGVVQNQI